jgi:hypothetical protein
MIPCIEIFCDDGNARGRLSVHLIHFGRILPGFLRNEKLADAARKLGSAAGID